MAKLVDYLSLKLKPYYYYILIISIVIVFILATIYAYYNYNTSKNLNSKKFDDVANKSNRSNNIEIMMFHVDWCPHCKKALPDWVSFCNYYNQREINGYVINCDATGKNCTDETNPEISTTISKYNIKSYPTVILFKEDKRYDFDAKLTRSSLEQFIESVTKQ